MSIKYGVARYLFGTILLIFIAGCGQAVSSTTMTSGGPSVAKSPASSRVAATPNSVPPTPFANLSTGRRDVGILDRHDGPFPTTIFGVVNQYSGSYQGQWLMIYAGGDRDPSQTSDPFVRGAIRIEIGPADSSEGSPKYVGEFDAPGSSSWVKLVGVSGDSVNLEGEDGSSVKFDLVTHAFSK